MVANPARIVSTAVEQGEYIFPFPVGRLPVRPLCRFSLLTAGFVADQLNVRKHNNNNF